MRIGVEVFIKKLYYWGAKSPKSVAGGNLLMICLSTHPNEYWSGIYVCWPVLRLIHHSS